MARTEDPDILALDEEGDGVLLERVPDRLGLESRSEVAHFFEAHAVILAATPRVSGRDRAGTGPEQVPGTATGRTATGRLETERSERRRRLLLRAADAYPRFRQASPS